MIKIVKNDDKKVVTMGAYKNFYEPLGYKPVMVKKEPVFDEVVTDKHEKEKDIIKDKTDEKDRK